MELSIKSPKQVEVVKSTLNCLIHLHGATHLGSNCFCTCLQSAKKEFDPKCDYQCKS